MIREQDESSSAEGGELTITQAAAAADVHPRTIRRHLPRFPGAHQSGRSGSMSGPWLIPVDDLLAAGFKVNAVEEETPEAPRADLPPMNELEALRAEVADLRLRAEVAEARAEERERVIEAQAVALRALSGC